MFHIVVKVDAWTSLVQKFTVLFWILLIANAISKVGLDMHQSLQSWEATCRILVFILSASIEKYACIIW